MIQTCTITVVVMVLDVPSMIQTWTIRVAVMVQKTNSVAIPAIVTGDLPSLSVSLTR